MATDCKDYSSEDIATYASEVDKRIATHSGDMFDNNNAAHAGVVLEKFVENAQESILIVCGKLSRMVYEKVYGLLRDVMLNKGVNVRVITSTDKVEAQEILDTLVEKKAIKYVTPKKSAPSDNAPFESGIPHFAIIDQKMMRFELDEKMRKAVACANVDDNKDAKEMVEKGLRAFEALWKHATPLTY